MTPPPSSPTRTLGDLRLALEQPVAHLLHVDDEALVRAVRDRVGAGGDRRLEGHAAAFDLDELHRHGDALAEERRPDVLPVDLGADRVLAGVEVLEQEIPAGVLDVADDARGRVDAAIRTHELDYPRVVDGDRSGMGKAGLEAGFHVPRSACGPRGSYPSRARRSSGWASWCCPR